MYVSARARVCVCAREDANTVWQSGPDVVFVVLKKCNDSLLYIQHLSRPYGGVKEGRELMLSATCWLLERSSLDE